MSASASLPLQPRPAFPSVPARPVQPVERPRPMAVVAGSAQLERDARLADLESDIRRVLRATLSDEPELADTRAAAQAIIANSGAVAELSRGIIMDGSSMGAIARDTIIHAYAHGLELLTDPEALRAWFLQRGRQQLQSADRYEAMAADHDRMACATVWPYRSEAERAAYRGRAANCRELAEAERTKAQPFVGAVAAMDQRVAA